jgi:hypothetical protein
MAPFHLTSLAQDERCAAVAREVGATDNRLPGYMHILRCIHNRTFITRDEFAQAFEVHLLPHHKAVSTCNAGVHVAIAMVGFDM